MRTSWWIVALRTLLWVASALAGSAVTAQSTPLPQVQAGRIERLASFASRHVDARHVDVWLPEGFSPDRRYAVLYMHDGQMLFDPASTWNRQAWQADVVAARLLAAGALRDFIIVGIWNNGSLRHSEYFPEKFLPHLPVPVREDFVERALSGKPRADAYLRFLVEELKPAIDARYPTVRDPSATFIMGSSMGGLISLYALLEYPKVFGGAAALSTHWIAVYNRNSTFPDAAIAYLKGVLPAPGSHRVYMDRGTIELDERYDFAQRRVDALLRERGYAAPGFETLVFEGEGHNERAWHRRLETPLRFLLGR